MRGRSALEVYRSLPTAAKEDVKAKSKNAKAGKKAKGGKGDKAEANEGGANPVKALQTVAKKLGLGSLSVRWEHPNTKAGLKLRSFLTNHTLFLGRLDGVKYENGKINVVNRKSGSKPKFYQKKWYVEKQMWAVGAHTKWKFLKHLVLHLCSSNLHDVTLKSEDGKEFPCHKSVLCARLGKPGSNVLMYIKVKVKKYISVFSEYFNSMLGNPWIEVGQVFISFKWDCKYSESVAPSSGHIVCCTGYANELRGPSGHPGVYLHGWVSHH